jgi:hypothetical protein
VQEQVERPLEHLGPDHVVHISTYLLVAWSPDRPVDRVAVWPPMVA